MNIDDLLRGRQFQSSEELEKYLSGEMEKTAGEDLISQMNEVFETPEKARAWYFSNSRALSGKRPYDLCQNGDIELVREELERLDWGIYS